MPSLFRKRKTCEKCGTQTVRNKVVQHKIRCSCGILYCTQCPIFYTTSQDDLIYHFAKRHSAPKTVVTYRCTLAYQEFPRLFASRQHKNTDHGFLIKTAKAEFDNIINEVDDLNFKDELRSCKQFMLVFELERARNNVFNYAAEKLKETVLNEKFDLFFNSLKCAANITITFGFNIKNIEDGDFRYFYAHGNITLLDRSKLVCTSNHLAKSKHILNKTDFIKSCS